MPLIVARVEPGRPGGAGTVIDTPVRHIDIVPTVLDAIGADADPKLLGSSLRPVIAGDQRGDRPTYFESMTYNLVRGWAPLRGVVAERNKYIDLPIPELYDLAADPKEASNLATAARDRVQVLTNLLRTYNVRSAEPSRARDRGGRRRAEVAGIRPGQRARARHLHRSGRPQASRRDRSRPAHRHRR